MAKTCTYYFAPQSSFSYVGHERFVALAKRYEVQVEIKPMNLGRVFSASGGLPLAQRAPQRQAYRLVELRRWSEHLGLAMNLQPAFRTAPGDAAAKLIIASQLAHGTEAALALTTRIMQALWLEEKNIADADTLIALANAAGHNGKELLKASETAGIQTQYDRFTDDALAANVFGAPWYVVDGEGYWGQDRLDFVERAFQK